MANLSNINNKFIVEDSGDVGIGVTSATTKLHIGGTAPGDSIIRQDSTVSGTNWEIGERAAGKWQIFEDDGDSIVATFMSTGNVGIGTDSPTSKLHLRDPGTNSDVGIKIGNDSRDWNLKVMGSVSDSLQFFTHDNSNVMTILPSGNVGIGVTSPTQKLDVVGAGGNTNIRVYDSSANSEVGLKLQSDAKTWTLQNWGSGGDNLRFLNNAGTSIMLLDEDGSIGIGTTDPDFTGFSWNVLTIQGGTGAGNAGVLELATPSTSANDQNLGIVSFNSGTNRNAQIAANRESADNNGRLTFWTSPGSGIEERMRIDSGGSVIIGSVGTSGTPASDYRSLEIGRQGNTITGAPWKSNLYLTCNGTVTAGSTAFTYRYANEAPARMDLEDGNITFYNSSAGTVGNTISWTQRMIINSSGNVGIGTTGPPSKLTVMESTLCTNSGTDGGTSYVPAKPILLVTTDGNGTPSSFYGTNSVFTVGIGGGITGGVTTKHLSVLLNGKVNIGTGTTVTGFLNIEKTGNHLHLRNSGATSGKYWNFDVASNNRLYILNNGDTGVYIVDGATSWTANSDESLKENIKPLNNVLDKIKDYRCVEYNFKSDKLKDKKIGFIAQDWVDDFAPIISKDDDGLLGMKYTETIPVLLKAIQELKADNDSLKARIETLENK